jgi:zinc transport system substrate-binding protein
VTPFRRLPVAAALALVLAGCGGSSPAGSGEGGPVQVAASFYPLQWVTAQVAGEHAEVSSLTPPGAEPHDLELGPRQVATIGEADLVVYLDGFQPAVDEAVAQEAGDSALDVTDPADLVETGGTVDPHFWLDPTRLADVADAVGQRLGEVDPARAAAFTDGAAEVRAELEALDAELAEGLAGCAGSDLVTSHTAFGYLAARYDMEQVGITGLSPESEPSPKALAEVADFVADNDVRTIYSEALVSPEVARTLARETGVQTAVLDPLEGLSSESSGEDYLSVMRANLAVLQVGQACR